MAINGFNQINHYNMNNKARTVQVKIYYIYTKYCCIMKQLNSIHKYNVYKLYVSFRPI